MTYDLDAIEKAASIALQCNKANGYDWEPQFANSDHGPASWLEIGSARVTQCEHADFIIACSPQAILAMCADLRRKREALAPMLSDKARALLEEMVEAEEAVGDAKVADAIKFLLECEDKRRAALKDTAP